MVKFVAAMMMVLVLGLGFTFAGDQTRTITVVGKVNVKLGNDTMKQISTLAGAVASQNLTCELTFLDNNKNEVYSNSLSLGLTAVKLLTSNGYVGNFNYSFSLDKSVKDLTVDVRVCGQVGMLDDEAKCMKVDKKKSAKSLFGLFNKSKIDFGTIPVKL